MKKRYLILLLIATFSLIFTPKVKALDQESEEIYDHCTLSEYNDLRKLASAVTVSFEHEKTVWEDDFFTKVKVGKFTITVNNLGNSLYAVEKITNKVADGSNNKMKNLNSNATYTVNVYALDGCTNKPLLTRYINIPRYNPYSEEEVCKEIKEFYMCDKWYSIYITDEQFEKGVENYKESLKKDDPSIDNTKDTKHILEMLWDFLVDNYIYVLIIIATISIVTIIILITKERRQML